MTPAAAAAGALVDQSRVHWDNGNLGEALACCQQALALDPDNVNALANTATLLWVQGDPDEAARLYATAHTIDPTHGGVILNIATLHNEAGDIERALEWIDKALVLDPGSAELVWRRSILELALGDYVPGWKHYEAGLGQAAIRGTGPGFRRAPWTGTRCRRLLIWHEQGLGDTIQFVRYAQLCKERAEQVIVLCPPELMALLATCPFVDAVVDTVGDEDFDEQVSIMSLPHVFRTTLATIPAPIPYLFARADRLPDWRHLRAGKRLAVGLTWSGNFRAQQLRFHRNDRNRNLAFAQMQPLLDIPDIAFYSLQKGPAAAEAAASDLLDPMPGVNDLADTAAIVAGLDLVISADTAVAHLAGALGKPVWVLSRLDACWRWLRNRPDSPWYPTARVFGQTRRGDWQSVIATVRAELARL